MRFAARVGQGMPPAMANNFGMDAHHRLATRVAQEQDDLLGTIQVVRDGELGARLFDQLVDLLVEGMFLDLRREYLDGRLSRADYVEELAQLAAQCRRAGLLPLPSRPA
jgi:hypothetical protein